MAQRPLASQRIAVLGAGIAGLACARRLARAGAKVVVHEAAAEVGGRLQTRQTECGPFDVGAQYFTLSHHAFERVLAPLLGSGAARPWHGKLLALWRGNRADKTASARRLVAVPGMQSLAEHFALGLDLRLGSRVTGLALDGVRWKLQLDPAAPDASEDDPGFDAVALALPGAAALELLPADSPLAAQLRAVVWDPIWAVGLALSRRVEAGFDAAFVNDDPLIAWIARDSGKPGRPRVPGVAERWVIHAQPRWSREHAAMPPDEVVHWLSHAFAARVGRAMRPRHAFAQFWPAARPANPLPRRCLWDATSGLGVAGDALVEEALLEAGGGPRVEAAFLSGLALAEAMVFE